MKRRGQVAVFVVVGLLLLFSVLFISFVQQSLQQSSFQNIAEENLESQIEQTALRTYVQSCVNRVANEGIILLAQQGGVIYDYQGGLTNSSTHPILYHEYVEKAHQYKSQEGESGSYVTYTPKKRNVSMGVLADVSCSNVYDYDSSLTQTNSFIDLSNAQEQDSWYPTPKTHFIDYMTKFRLSLDNGGCRGSSDDRVQRSGYMGTNNMAPLCSYDGLNAFNVSSLAVCSPYYYDSAQNNHSLQRQLDTYIKNNLNSCVNFSVFESNAANMRVNESAIEVFSAFQKPKGISFQVRYPFVITIQGKTTTAYADFFEKFDYDLEHLYYYTTSLLSEFVRNPEFDLRTDWNTTTTMNRHYKKSFVVEYEQEKYVDDDKIVLGTNNVLRIKDSASQVGDQSLYFNIGVQQRAPVLDYLRQKGTQLVLFDKPIDYQFVAGKPIKLEPSGIDPDLDDIEFQYGGWRQEYTTIVDWQCCQEDEANLQKCIELDSTSNCVDVFNLNDNGTIDQKEFGSSSNAQETVPTWMNSSLYQQTNQSASIPTTVEDIGVHDVLVMLRDEFGQIDFQNVSILVFDLPEAHLNLLNEYDDVNNSFASIEDKYIVNASRSQPSTLLGGHISTYVFKDNTEDFRINSTDDVFFVANHSLYSSFNLSLGKFTKQFFSTADDSSPQKHLIEFYVQQNQTTFENDDLATSPTFTSEVLTQDVYVAQCLPHGYDGGYDFDVQDYATDTYPLLTVLDPDNSDLLQSPHVCCDPNSFPSLLEGGKFYSNNQKCFSIHGDDFITCAPNDYEDWDYFSHLLVESNDGSSSLETYDDYEISSTDNSFNDILSLAISQECSGSRGAFCSGDVTITRESLQVCNDFNDFEEQYENLDLDGQQFARCQGPGFSQSQKIQGSSCGENFVLKESIDEHNVMCYNYSSQNSFEKDRSLEVDDEYIDLLDEGLCGSEQGVDIGWNSQGLQIDPVTTSEVFSCYATCDETSGQCSYHDVTQCKMSLNADEKCQGISAELFFSDNNDYFVCRATNDNSAGCDEEGNSYESQTTAIGCTCATALLQTFGDDTWADTSFLAEFENITPNWFGNSLQPYDDYNIDRCCDDEDDYFSQSDLYKNNGRDWTCIAGDLVASGDIVSDNRLLSLDGIIYPCFEDFSDCRDVFTSSLCLNNDATVDGFECTGSGWEEQ
ncbi:MAG: hypothetical protein ACLFNM_00260 [Candidatus Woesearchaeota archaeon]